MNPLRLKWLFVGVLLWTANHAKAQTPMSCEPSIAEALLEENNVRARIFNNGQLFWRGSPDLYEVPKGSGTNSLYFSKIWLGAMVDESLRISGSTYGPPEFWSGPVEEVSQGADCAQYDRIYSISRHDFNSMDRGEPPPEDVIDWPWQLGAPVVDGDGDPTNYDLEAGDRPELLGDESLFWIMNDIGNEHVRGGTLPLGVEVHVTAFSTTNDSNIHLPNTTFYRYRIINRNTEPYKDAYFGLFVDADLGNWLDDYVGSDSTLNLGYAYNGDNDDEGHGGYGTAPPAVGIQVTQSPLADQDGKDNDGDGVIDELGEMLGMTAFVRHNHGGGFTGIAQNGSDMYNYMQALWRDGRPITYGGTGHGFSERPFKFMYSGTPPGFWTEFNLDNMGAANPSGDRHFVMGVGPFDLAPGEETEILLSIITAFGDDNLDSVVKLKEAAASFTGLTARTVPRGAPGGPSREAPQILSPGSGAVNQSTELNIRWTWDGPNSKSEVQLAKNSDFPRGQTISTWERDRNFELEPNEVYGMRVRVRYVDGNGIWSPVTWFSTGSTSFDQMFYLDDITVVQNGLGPLDPPEGASADWRGFPGTGRPTDRQQQGDGQWILAAPQSWSCVTGNCGDLSIFFRKSLGKT